RLPAAGDADERDLRQRLRALALRVRLRAQPLAREPVREDRDERLNRRALQLLRRLLDDALDLRTVVDPLELGRQLIDVMREPDLDVGELLESHDAAAKPTAR